MGLPEAFRGFVSGLTSKGVEGQFREGPWVVDAGVIPAGWGWNFWQSGRNPINGGAGRSPMVRACVKAYAETVAMCPGTHWVATGKQGRERNSTSAASRLLRKPNDYQSISDFLLNLTWNFKAGEAFALILRNNRFEADSLHIMPKGKPILGEDGSIFYDLSGNEIIRRRLEALGLDGLLIVPARDVMHVRAHTPVDPLKGESDLMCLALDLAARDMAIAQQVQFFANRSRPSFVLSTDQRMNAAQAQEARERWNLQAQGLNEGGTVVLSNGLKPLPLSSSAVDSQLAETLKLSDEAVALAYRIPLQIFGRGNSQGGTTESLMSSWVAQGLGFTLNHIEQALDAAFGLRGWPEDYVELDTAILLRSDFKSRIEGLGRGVQTGVFSPDEARAREDLPAVPGGHGSMPRVQVQNVRLDSDAFKPKTPEPGPPANPPPSDGEGDDLDDDQEGGEDAGRNADDWVERIWASAGLDESP